MEAGLLEVGAGDDGEDARRRQSARCVDRLDLRVRVRRPDDVEPEHARQDDVIDVLAGAADEAGVLLALDGVAHPPDFGRRLRLQGRFGCHRPHFGRFLAGAPAATSSPAVRACVVRRHHRRALGRPERPRRLLDRLDDVHVARAPAEVAGDALADLGLGGLRVVRSSQAACMIMPGVQNPHCRPCWSQNACWSGCSPPTGARPSMVVMLERRRPGRRASCTTWRSRR